VLTDGRQRADYLLEVGTQIRFSVISWIAAVTGYANTRSVRRLTIEER
jgi:hypothetical protein